MPVLAFRPAKFDPERVFSIMEKYSVRNLMVVPTVLWMMMNKVKNVRERYNIRLRSVTAGGETMGEELYRWSAENLGVELNEQYGQTECDLGRKDQDGYFWFAGRADDLIESGGYRIGPGEIEECLMTHKAVAMVCVLGVPEPVRGQIVKAFIVPHPGFKADLALEGSIREHVKGKLEAHAYPRAIQFLEEMPMTKTGKIMKNKLKEL